jgi:hypothetical protein
MDKKQRKLRIPRTQVKRALIGSSFEVAPALGGRGPMLRVSAETHEKLKKLSTYSNRSMTSIIASAIAAIQMPTTENGGGRAGK